jgi:hypothetical protein
LHTSRGFCFSKQLTASGVQTLANNNTVGNDELKHGAKVRKRLTSETMFLIFDLPENLAARVLHLPPACKQL